MVDKEDKQKNGAKKQGKRIGQRQEEVNGEVVG